ncbi:GNAT family N-acetyltransferase [Streptomyces sp. NPDC096153]|uniref:GNAT family N-acetyltransferase n=1 Tax=Streptomyces sp. NPDC096153 TaxID=3155548 RepID=UPI0033286B94
MLFDDPAFDSIVAALAREYKDKYGLIDEMDSYGASDFNPPNGRLLVLQVKGRTVAGGAFRRLNSSTAEVKRMWVDPDMRGHGFGRMVLEYLELEIRRHGCTHVRLETGDLQKSAIRLYASAGYQQIDGYGRIGGHSWSLAFEKKL